MEKITMILQIGFRNIWRSPKRSWLVMSTAMIGMMGVLFSMGFFNGTMNSLIQAGIYSGLGHVQVLPEGFNKKRKNGMLFSEPEKILEKLQAHKEELEKDEIYVSPRLQKEGFIRLGTFSRGLMVLGVDPEPEKKVSYYADWVIDGDYLSEKTEEIAGVIPVLLGEANARKMEVETGDFFVLTVSDNEGESVSRQARIAGIFSSRSEPIDKYMLVVRRSDFSQMLTGEKNALSAITVRGKNLDLSDSIKTRLQKIFSDEESDILTYIELQPEINRMLDLSAQFTGIFYVILLSGFGLTLLNAVLMSVFERTREIGILRAIGTGSSDLFWMVVFESLFLGLIGATVGILIAVPVILYYYFNGLSLAAFAKGMELYGAGSTVFLSVSPENVLIGYVLTIIISFLATIYPALRAVRLIPVKAIYDR